MILLLPTTSPTNLLTCTVFSFHFLSRFGRLSPASTNSALRTITFGLGVGKPPSPKSLTTSGGGETTPFPLRHFFGMRNRKISFFLFLLTQNTLNIFLKNSTRSPNLQPSIFRHNHRGSEYQERADSINNGRYRKIWDKNIACHKHAGNAAKGGDSIKITVRTRNCINT